MSSIIRRDSGVGCGGHDNPENSGYPDTRHSSAFSAASMAGAISEETTHVSTAPDPNRLAAPSALSAGFGSASSNEGSTDSLLDQDNITQDLHNLSMAVTQQALD